VTYVTDNTKKMLPLTSSEDAVWILHH